MYSVFQGDASFLTISLKATHKTKGLRQ